MQYKNHYSDLSLYSLITEDKGADTNVRDIVECIAFVLLLVIVYIIII